MILLATRWGFENHPILFPAEWNATPTGASLYGRWFGEASMPIGQAVTAFAARPLRSGLFGLPSAFFRTPFLAFDDKLVGISPWHVRDYATCGTWAKLNAACKKLLHSTSSTTFSSAFGYSFERWCADLAREADGAGAHPSESLLLPSQSGAEDEIEDVVFHDGEFVALLSAKASLVPEASLKAADSPEDAVRWLRRFFFEDPDAAKGHGHRGGSIYLLDKKIALIRAGVYDPRGIPRTAVVLPAVVCFDNVGESGILYKWLEQESAKRKLLRHDNVRSLTIITPTDHEALMALKARGHGVCQLLVEKTEVRNKWRPINGFLFSKVENSVELRLPSTKRRFDALIDRSLARMKRPRGTSAEE